MLFRSMMLGLSAIMNNWYKVTSNRESGDGRYDIQMEPYDQLLPGILAELKVLSKRSVGNAADVADKLKTLSEETVHQINRRNYEELMLQKGVKQIIKLGIAFYKKQVEIFCVTDSV